MRKGAKPPAGCCPAAVGWASGDAVTGAGSGSGAVTGADCDTAEAVLPAAVEEMGPKEKGCCCSGGAFEGGPGIHTGPFGV